MSKQTSKFSINFNSNFKKKLFSGRFSRRQKKHKHENTPESDLGSDSGYVFMSDFENLDYQNNENESPLNHLKTYQHSKQDGNDLKNKELESILDYYNKSISKPKTPNKNSFLSQTSRFTQKLNIPTRKPSHNQDSYAKTLVPNTIPGEIKIDNDFIRRNPKASKRLGFISHDIPKTKNHSHKSNFIEYDSDSHSENLIKPPISSSKTKSIVNNWNPNLSSSDNNNTQTKTPRKYLPSISNSSHKSKSKNSNTSKSRKHKIKKNKTVGKLSSYDASILIKENINTLLKVPSEKLQSRFNSFKGSDSGYHPELNHISKDISSSSTHLFIVDTRSYAEYEEGHIISAISLAELKDKSIVKKGTAQLLTEYIQITSTDPKNTKSSKNITLLFYDDGNSENAWKQAVIYKELQISHTVFALYDGFSEFSKEYFHLCYYTNINNDEIDEYHNMVKKSLTTPNSNRGIDQYYKKSTPLKSKKSTLFSRKMNRPVSSVKLSSFPIPNWLKQRSGDDAFGISIASTFFSKIEQSENNRLKEIQEIKNNNSNMIADFSFDSGHSRIAHNRYPNILPYDHSRVIIGSGGSENDYINASHVGLPGGPQYIVSQGPMKTTVNDFWQMIWEKEIGVIVMLGELIENGREKCYQYWPKTFGIWKRCRINGKTENGGEPIISIRMEAGADDCNFPGITVRLFRVRLSINGVVTEKARLITQVHYWNWSDHSVPSNIQCFLRTIKLATCAMGNVTFNTSSIQSILVHCSAGCGRSGVFCAIDTALKLKKGNNPVIVEDYDPMYSIVSAMRRQRMGIVQSLEQFMFCYKALLSSFSEPTLPYPQLNVVSVPIEQLKLVVKWNRLRSKVFAPDSAHTVWIMVAFMEIASELKLVKKKLSYKYINNDSTCSLTEIERPFSTSCFVSRPPNEIESEIDLEELLDYSLSKTNDTSYQVQNFKTYQSGTLGASITSSYNDQELVKRAKTGPGITGYSSQGKVVYKNVERKDTNNEDSDMQRSRSLNVNVTTYKEAIISLNNDNDTPESLLDNTHISAINDSTSISGNIPNNKHITNHHDEIPNALPSENLLREQKENDMITLKKPKPKKRFGKNPNLVISLSPNTGDNILNPFPATPNIILTPKKTNNSAFNKPENAKSNLNPGKNFFSEFSEPVPPTPMANSPRFFKEKGMFIAGNKGLINKASKLPGNLSFNGTNKNNSYKTVNVSSGLNPKVTRVFSDNSAFKSKDISPENENNLITASETEPKSMIVLKSNKNLPFLESSIPPLSQFTKHNKSSNLGSGTKSSLSALNPNRNLYQPSPKSYDFGKKGHITPFPTFESAEQSFTQHDPYSGTTIGPGISQNYSNAGDATLFSKPTKVVSSRYSKSDPYSFDQAMAEDRVPETAPAYKNTFFRDSEMKNSSGDVSLYEDAISFPRLKPSPDPEPFLSGMTDYDKLYENQTINLSSLRSFDSYKSAKSTGASQNRNKIVAELFPLSSDEMF
ncbi:hypothetical protein BB559_007546 [Furculomyces boomerangus]|uniref:protein-tyrosine-phosphatase n=1 Tax=Furculomyces boomerangus TaxID=61424 RepID=A0A2T9XWZ1_9FUNG|nr:hypothetical protein BB559_007546 [Furculomyces boomerangus]